MNAKLSTLTGVAAVATIVGQGIWALASGSFSVGSRIYELQSEIRLLRKDVQSQQAIYDLRLNLVEQKLPISKKS
jgi:hypothetical protein